MRSYRNRRTRRSGKTDGMWLSFSDLMSSLLMIIILIMFYIMYQYFDMYEINMAEIARQQFDLEAANASIAQANESIEEQRGKLTEAEQQMLAQQIRLNAAEAELQDAEAILVAQQNELAAAQSLLQEKEDEIAAQKESLDALSVQLGIQQTQILEQQDTLNTQQATLDSQQATLDSQQQQIEQLVGMKPKIISSLSSALKKAKVAATVDQGSGAIALEADVLFSTGQYRMTDAGRATIDEFLPVYLDVLFSDDYLPYVAEIIIEGHTDSVGSYITNLELSQQRANAVASYVLDENYSAITPRQRELLREMSTANGRSYSDPVLDANGVEDKDASRRVVFKFRLTDEQMIQQLKEILEQSEDFSAGVTAEIEAAE